MLKYAATGTFMCDVSNDGCSYMHIALLFLSKGRSELVSGGVVVLPCFVLNRSHRFNHIGNFVLLSPHTIVTMMVHC